jgi:hypothetical protein
MVAQPITESERSQPLIGFASNQAENDEPQPHDDLAFGFSNLKPDCVSDVR